MQVSRTLIASAVVASLGGFLFGFDTVVISGAEQKIQSLWQLSPQMHGLAMSAALWGTVAGAIGGAWPTDRLGRRATLLWVGVLYFTSALWSAFAWDVYSFIVARMIGGIGVGISTVAAPLYITEIAPPRFRGRLTGMFQFNIVFGILIAYLSNSLLQDTTSSTDWRWMMGVEAIPAMFYTLFCFFIPESPRWLIAARGDRASGLLVLKKINPDVDVEILQRQVAEIAKADSTSTESDNSNSRFWTRRLRYPIMLAVLVAFFNQLSGINAILYFAPRILGMTGLANEAALLQSVGIGITNLLFTLLGLWLIDRVGRRPLLLIGSLGYILSLGMIAWVFHANSASFGLAADAMDAKVVAEKRIAAGNSTASNPAAEKLVVEELNQAIQRINNRIVVSPTEPTIESLAGDLSPDEVILRADEIIAQASEQSGMGGRLVLWGIFAFIAAHAVGQGAVIWVLVSEVFPNEHRAAGQSLGSATHWVFAALLTLYFPTVVSFLPPSYVFAFFCGMMVLQLLWVIALVPETKGVSLEDLQQQLRLK